MLYKVTYFGNAVNYGSEQFLMCPMFVTECFHNKCFKLSTLRSVYISPGCESDMILSVMTMAPNMGLTVFPRGKLTGGILKFVLAANNKKSVSGKFQPLIVANCYKLMGQ